jgi:hypothetical protein
MHMQHCTHPTQDDIVAPYSTGLLQQQEQPQQHNR